jgi:hypothetical protein
MNDDVDAMSLHFYLFAGFGEDDDEAGRRTT